MTIPTEIKEAFQKLANPGPLYWVWVFDPQDAEVELYNEEDHPLDTPGHSELAAKHPHPERLHGYAYRIVNGWRITDWEHKALEDPFVVGKVQEALKHGKS